MTIEFQLSKNDFKLSNKQLFYKSIRIIIVILIIITIVFNLSIFKNQYNWKTDLFALFRFLVISTCVYVFIFYLLYQYLYFKLFKKLKSYPDLLTKRSITFDQEGVLIKSENIEKKLSWYAVSGFTSSKDFIVLYLFNGNDIIIPKNCLVDSYEISTLIGIIDTNLKILRRKNGTTSKYNYFDKKSKRLFILGGVIILFIYLGTIINHQPKKNNTKKESIQSQKELNIIVKEIEYYKVRMGVYPDSLTQPDFYFSANISLNDHITTNKKSHYLYQYKKMDQIYTLYSVGYDGIKKTKDDIFPNVKIDSISSIGWRKP